MITKDFKNQNIVIQEMKNKILQRCCDTQSNLSVYFFTEEVPSNSVMTTWSRGTSKVNNDVPFKSPQTRETAMNGVLAIKLPRPHQHHNSQPSWQFSCTCFACLQCWLWSQQWFFDYNSIDFNCDRAGPVTNNVFVSIEYDPKQQKVHHWHPETPCTHCPQPCLPIQQCLSSILLLSFLASLKHSPL